MFTGHVEVDEVGEADINDLIGSLVATQRGRSFLAWRDYQVAAELHSRLVRTESDPHDLLLVDGLAECAARIAITFGIGQGTAERLITEGLALRDRLPQVAQRLRDGRISAERVKSIIARTDLVDGHDCAAEVDADIAARLDLHQGAWSSERLRDMVDRIVYRHDPDAVRERRQTALDARGVHTQPLPDGMARYSATMSAENARLSDACVKALAETVCAHDARTAQQRRSDAAFALLTGTAFECECDGQDCTAVTPEQGAAPPTGSRVVVHVVVDESTLNGDADNAGHLAGHGVISGEHARDLAARPDAVIKPLVAKGTPENADGPFTLPAHLPSDPYRPSTALDTFVRIRDGSSVIPGSTVSAFDADLDHVGEFDHENPAQGGPTSPDNLNAKHRFGHLLKTFGKWVDDQFRDRHGDLRTEFITPEGLVIPGDPENLEVLFPGLRRIRFTGPPLGDAGPDAGDQPPPARRMSRVAAKHARRRQERERNRRRRESEGESHGGSDTGPES
ncbi:hypothetical protein D7316_04936 [Gordonia insulae]|uniref:DUF222 domain-containing protein n=2 Tax=Gordonia insulae TaxID=2420509 RepID=A0A3G8JUT2_9ACTN|nr:hypothetical protein D7316_04936 [Gordonia insulae]